MLLATFFVRILTILMPMFVLNYVPAKAEEHALCSDSSLMTYCECDDEVSSKTESAKCKSWNNPPNPEQLWAALKEFKNVNLLEFMCRPPRNLTVFPPPEVFTELVKLTRFTMKFANISTLVPYTFANLTSIADIKLKDNGITTLESNSFANMQNVSEINLGSNEITEINRQVFVNLPKLKSLFLDQNKIQVVHDNAFKDLFSLEELDLKKNNLTVITREVFFGLGNLKTLELQENVIEYLGDKVFADLINLEDLDLWENQIRSIHPNAFYNLKNIRRLSIQKNKIVTLEPPIFSHLSMVYMLDLRDNALESLSEVLMEPIYTNLKNTSMQLYMTGNRFRCDCHILWMVKLYQDTNSENLKGQLGKVTCEFFSDQNPNPKGKAHRHVSYANITVDTSSPEETTTYSFDGTRNVTELNPSEFKCHHHHHNGEQSPVVSEHKKDLQQSQHQSHIETNPSSSSSFYLNTSVMLFSVVILQQAKYVL